MTQNPLLFTPPCSNFDPSFWEELYHRKLNIYRLDSTAVPINATFTLSDSREIGVFKFHRKSFEEDSQTGTGKLMNFNKIEVN
jgi:hypothetical protein